MNKIKMLKMVNVLLALSFILTATGGMVRFFAPSMIPYETYKVVHPIFGMFLIVFVLTHVTLNFEWIKSTYFNKK